MVTIERVGEVARVTQGDMLDWSATYRRPLSMTKGHLLTLEAMLQGEMRAQCITWGGRARLSVEPSEPDTFTVDVTALGPVADLLRGNDGDRG